MKRFLPFVFLYFFINTIVLPFGLTWTSVLAPFFYLWILLCQKKEIAWPFILFVTIPLIVQLVFVGVNRPVYYNSLLHFFLVYISCQAAYYFFKVCTDPASIFKNILIVNFILCLIAIMFYFLPQYSIFWIEQGLTQDISDFRRLKMFTYEASYYALLFVPVFCFFLLQYLFKKNTINGWLLLPMVFLPMVLSFSAGVIGALILSGVICFFIHPLRLLSKQRIFTATITGGFAVLIILPFAYIFRDTVLGRRIENIFGGNDTSANGRTTDAYILAKKMLMLKSEWWGIGLGQVKVIGTDIYKEYYLYYESYAAAIPNAVAETWAIFGWVGIIFRFSTEIFLFFYTRVWMNHYRLLLFFFVFIYQFTGSYTTNTAEYVIWILAFTNVFTVFDVKPSFAAGVRPATVSSGFRMP